MKKIVLASMLYFFMHTTSYGMFQRNIPLFLHRQHSLMKRQFTTPRNPTTPTPNNEFQSLSEDAQRIYELLSSDIQQIKEQITAIRSSSVTKQDLDNIKNVIEKGNTHEYIKIISPADASTSKPATGSRT